MEKIILFFLLVSQLLVACMSLGYAENVSYSTPIPDSTEHDASNVYRPDELITLSNKVKATAQYYVSPNGNNTGAGTREDPFRNIEFALFAVRTFRYDIADDMEIILMGGTYYLSDTLKINHFNDIDKHSLTIRADEGDRTIISGGIPIIGWEPVKLNGNTVFKANVTGLDYGRTFYVDDEPMNLASMHEPKGVKFRWVIGSDYNAIRLQNTDVSRLHNAAQTEVVWHCQWKLFLHRVERAEGSDVLHMLQPFFSYATTPATVGGLDPGGWWFPNEKYQVYLQNDISFIDTPGEYCYDESEKIMYYYPKDGRDPNTQNCVVSYLDTIMEVKGDIVHERVKDITFKNLIFSHGGFPLLGKTGIAVLQAHHYYNAPTTEQTKGVHNVLAKISDDYYEGNILVEAANNINFINCGFMNTVKALHFNSGVEDSSVIGCWFKDIGDSAVVVTNGHDAFVSGEQLTRNIHIENNLIRNVGLVNHSVPAIAIYYSRDNSICHNDIYDISGTGISIGWGWYLLLSSTYTKNNVIEYNRIGRFMTRVRDGGGIYTLGQSPDSVIRYNYIFEQYGPFGGLYHDEGSAGYLTEWNVVDNNTNPHEPGQTWLWLNSFPTSEGIHTVYNLQVQDNFTSNLRQDLRADPDTVTVERTTFITGGNWPEKAREIIDNAGLEKHWQHLHEILEKRGKIQ